MVQVIKVGGAVALCVVLILIAVWLLWSAFGSPGAPSSPSPTTVTMNVPVMPEDIDRG